MAAAQARSSFSISILEGYNRGIEQQIELEGVIAARSRKPGRTGEELPCTIGVAIVQLEVGEVSMFGGDHSLLPELNVQLDALFIEEPRG